MMKISMQSAPAGTGLLHQTWDHAIVGDAIDPRGDAAVAFARQHANQIHKVRYDAKELAIEIGAKMYSAEEPEKAFSAIPGCSVLLEATTLGFVELLLCCRAFIQNAPYDLSFLYIEPDSYFRPARTDIFGRRDFSLSDEVEDFAAVPGNTVLLLDDRPIKVAVFLGYEGQRLNRFLEQTSVPISKCEIIFGVPGFQPGWEMNAFANNFSVISGEKMASRLHFCGADNPLSVYKRLNGVYNSCESERMLVTPIGTKPHGIGTALFLCEHPDVGVVYDNPKRKMDRTDKIGRWHLFGAAA